MGSKALSLVDEKRGTAWRTIKPTVYINGNTALAVRMRGGQSEVYNIFE